MAKKSGLGHRLFIEGYDVSGDTSEYAIGSPLALVEVTGIDKSAFERIPGLRDGSLTWTSYFNPATGETHDTLAALPATDVGLMVCMGTTIGDPTAFLDAKQVDYPGTRAQDGSLSFSLSAQGSAGVPVEYGVLLTPGSVTHASADEEAGLLQTAQSSAGGVGWLQVFSAASGTATFIIEDSSDSTDGADGTWGTLLTFAGDSGDAPFAERKEVTGTVEKYVRASTTGTFTNAVFAMGFRRGTANDFKDLSS